VKEKSACEHVNTSMFKSIFVRGDYLRKVIKVKCTLMATLSNPYIGLEGANAFYEMRRHLREPLEMACTVEMKSLCALVR